jgi:predicted DNA-binding transcriptional regulator AlpA
MGNVPEAFHFDRRAGELIQSGVGPPDDLLTSHEMCRWFGVSRGWFEYARQRNYGPPYVKFGRRVRYRRGDILKWLEERKVVPGPKPRFTRGIP